MKRIITVLASMLCLCMVSQAKLALSSVCSDGMVLQQNTEARIWGTSDPGAQVTGIDRWGKEYASFNKPLCEENARAEGVENISFMKGDVTHLDFPDETFDAVASNYVYHNIPSRDRQAILLETLRTLKKGGTFAIHDIFSAGKYGDMQSFMKKLKEMGYERVELIDTANGKWMSKGEAGWMGLSGSALLTGKK